LKDGKEDANKDFIKKRRKTEIIAFTDPGPRQHA